MTSGNSPYEPWMVPFLQPSVWGHNDCVEFLISWAHNVHHRRWVRPEGLSAEMQGSPPSVLAKAWSEGLREIGCVETEYAPDIILVETRHYCLMAVMVNGHYVTRGPRGLYHPHGQLTVGFQVGSQ